LHLLAQKFLRELGIAIKVHATNRKERAIVDFDSHGDGSIWRYFAVDPSDCVRVPQVIQAAADGESDSLKRERIRGLTEAWSKFLVCEQFFDLLWREQPGAGVLHFREKRQFLKLEDQIKALLLTVCGEGRAIGFLRSNSNRFEPAKFSERANVALHFCGIERFTRV
jgi:hypothetical protein